MLRILFLHTSHSAIRSALILYSKSIAVIFAASLTHSIWAADGIELPKTIAWSAYPTGTGGYSQAVAIGNISTTGSEVLLWSNDYPHTEGTFPRSREVIDSIVEALPLRDAENLFFRNAARLYDFDLDYLAAHKDEVAPPAA